MVEPAAPWPASFFCVDAVNAADVKMFQSECIAEPGQHCRAEKPVNVSRVASAFRRKAFRRVASAFRRKRTADIERPAEAGSHS
jgi:hypothetical protein